MPEKKGFSTVGTESYNIKGVGDQKRVTLNIQEDESVGIVLEKSGSNAVSSGGFLSRANAYLAKFSSIKPEQKATFFHLLAVMINAGIPMVKALKSLVAQNADNPKFQMIISDLGDSIEGGRSFSESLLDYPDVFLDQEVGMVKSGEASGQLNKVLENIANDAEKSYQIKHKIKSAMIYPIVVFSILILVIVGMMIFVVPQLTELFEGNNTELPLITRIVVGISDFMVSQKITMLLGAVAIYVFFSIFKKTQQGRFLVDNFKISVPMFGSLFKKAYLSRFARSLSNLLDSNISIIKAMEITANSMGNEVYKRRLLLSNEDMKQGIPLAENLMESDLFPPMLVNMVDVGERTAQLDSIMAKVADYYEEEVDTSVAGLSKMIEPLILVVIGGTVGSVVAAIMLPIMKLTDVAGSL